MDPMLQLQFARAHVRQMASLMPLSIIPAAASVDYPMNHTNNQRTDSVTSCVVERVSAGWPTGRPSTTQVCS